MNDHQELNEQGQARRRFLKQAGTVAWASPFIVTMMSRTAQAGHTANCGTQALDAGLGVILCDTTGALPCGTAHACVPDPDAGTPAVGKPCICVSA